MSNFISSHPDLPSHHHGVHVENDMDARRLIYLIEDIGAAKVEASAARYSAKYPGSKIYVSALLKHYHIHVPVRIFAPTIIPLYRVYFLLDQDSSKFKIGFSGDWIQRTAAFKCAFDLDRSIGISFGSDKASARAAEKMAKTLFRAAASKPPPSVPFGAFGHEEWFDSTVFDDAVAAVSMFNTQHQRESMSLRDGLALDLLRDRRFCWKEHRRMESGHDDDGR